MYLIFFCWFYLVLKNFEAFWNREIVNNLMNMHKEKSQLILTGSDEDFRAFPNELQRNLVSSLSKLFWFTIEKYNVCRSFDCKPLLKIVSNLFKSFSERQSSTVRKPSATT